MSPASLFLQERSISILAIICGSYIIFILIQKIVIAIQRSRFARERGCKPIPSYSHKEPIFGLDIFLENVELSKTGGFMERVRERYAGIRGGVHTYTQLILGDRAINTSEPENIKAILATQFKDFELATVCNIDFPR